MVGEDTEIRLGMIGCGLISHAHGLAALNSPIPLRFVACASRDAGRVDGWVKTYGCDCGYTDYREMLRNERLDGVVVATWPVDHLAHISDALAAGVRFILCEKPLVMDGREAALLAERAARAQAIVVEGFMYRHGAAMSKVADLLAGGAVGKVDSIQAVFHMHDDEEGADASGAVGWRQMAAAGGGVLHDFLCYPVDAANRFSGARPQRVFATGMQSRTFDVVNRLYAMVEYANGVVASVGASRGSSYSQNLRISGSDAVLELPTAWTPIDNPPIRLIRSPAFISEAVEQIEAADPVDSRRLIDLPAFTRQIENFARTITGETLPFITIEESVTNACVLDAIARSMASGSAEIVDRPPLAGGNQ